METQKKRCTFAIISHPDAGKTTVTERLLWFGQVIRQTGMVKSKSGQYAKSDWMQMEKDRGISITSSVMSFEYNDRYLHLLDTPGHKDFSEDTYRTLTAVESCLMMIDSAKGAEAQTVKLMQVCRLRQTPIISFMNKYDREAMDPFELIDNLEKDLSIECVPMSWPVGMGADFKGVYDIKSKQVKVFRDQFDPFNPSVVDASDLTTAEVKSALGEENCEKLAEDLEMIETILPAFNQDDFLSGKQTPVYFGSALYNFGVKEVLEALCEYAPGPKTREASLPPYDEHAEKTEISPEDKKFSGFIFKIQANMDPKHRDRIAFMRVCSGVFERNSKVYHERTGKEIKVASPVIFQARDRDIVDQAYPGDIIGLHDTGKFQIGDTFTLGKSFRYTGIPSFAPEIFMQVTLKDPLKMKHLQKGLQQLSEEGTVQLFVRKINSDRILGAVGMLQFDVVKFRLADEYGVEASYQASDFAIMRWPKFPDDQSKKDFIANYSSNIFVDGKERVCYGAKSAWDLKLAEERNEKIRFFNNSDYR